MYINVLCQTKSKHIVYDIELCRYIISTYNRTADDKNIIILL